MATARFRFAASTSTPSGGTSVTRNCSLCSSISSPRMSMVMFFSVSLGAKVRMPGVAELSS